MSTTEYYLKNREAILARCKVYREKNREAKKIRDAAYRAKTKDKMKIYRKAYNLQRKEELNRASRLWSIQFRYAVLSRYSSDRIPKCNNPGCPEHHQPHVEFLQVDHINDGGKEHKRSIGRTIGREFLDWLVENDYPSGYQILCANCNLSKELQRRALLPKGRNYVYRKRLKLEALMAYGGRCSCETCPQHWQPDLSLLTIDHIDGTGADHRRQGFGSGDTAYAKLRRLGYPEGYQVLCANCNTAKGAKVACPHHTGFFEATTSEPVCDLFKKVRVSSSP